METGVDSAQLMEERPTLSHEGAGKDGDADPELSELVFFNLKFVMTKHDIKRFWWKVVFVFVLTYALIPVLAEKNRVPKIAFTMFLVILHLFILVVYFWKVKV